MIYIVYLYLPVLLIAINKKGNIDMSPYFVQLRIKTIY